mmetsp:Transcript_21631/g.62207  ORF Transcript_21631/g.62207 Transcript_21631/m.62207 type:complete len:371 (+) Transcript_21631:695-1807(+)
MARSTPSMVLPDEIKGLANRSAEACPNTGCMSKEVSSKPRVWRWKTGSIIACIRISSLWRNIASIIESFSSSSSRAPTLRPLCGPPSPPRCLFAFFFFFFFRFFLRRLLRADWLSASSPPSASSSASPLTNAVAAEVTMASSTCGFTGAAPAAAADKFDETCAGASAAGGADTSPLLSGGAPADGGCSRGATASSRFASESTDEPSASKSCLRFNALDGLSPAPRSRRSSGQPLGGAGPGTMYRGFRGRVGSSHSELSTVSTEWSVSSVSSCSTSSSESSSSSSLSDSSSSPPSPTSAPSSVDSSARSSKIAAPSESTWEREAAGVKPLSNCRTCWAPPAKATNRSASSAETSKVLASKAAATTRRRSAL